MALAAGIACGDAAAAPVCPASALPGVVAQAGVLRDRVGRAALERPAPGAADVSDDRLAELARDTAAWQDFALVVAAVSGRSQADAGALRAIARAALADSGVPLTCDRGVTGRDRVAWQMSLAGYSPREIADVLEGRLTRKDLDRAQALRLAGYGDDAASALLESAIAARAEDRRQRAARARPGDLPLAAPPVARYAAEIDRLSRAHRIDPALVHALVAAESGGDARAVSRAGAIGLMQLMPATAAFLGVNPWDPLDNLRGGIAYLAGLLRTYGNERDALVAYNAGPGHADRVRKGLASLYDETRRYLKAIEGRYRPLKP